MRGTTVKPWGKIKPRTEGIVQSQDRHPQIHTTDRGPRNLPGVGQRAIRRLRGRSLSSERGIDSRGRVGVSRGCDRFRVRVVHPG